MHRANQSPLPVRPRPGELPSAWYSANRGMHFIGRWSWDELVALLNWVTGPVCVPDNKLPNSASAIAVEQYYDDEIFCSRTQTYICLSFRTVFGVSAIAIIISWRSWTMPTHLHDPVTYWAVQWRRSSRCWQRLLLLLLLEVMMAFDAECTEILRPSAELRRRCRASYY